MAREGEKFHEDNVPAARQLRRNETDTEAAVWALLRNRGLLGLKLRRQHPIGAFVVDFYCERLMLVVEIDGGIHKDPSVRAADGERQALLEARDLRFVRIPADLVPESPERVREYLAETLKPLL